MNALHTCPKCGAAMPVDAPEGLCPACLMSGAFATGVETVRLPGATPPAPSQPSTPTPEELAPLFPDLEIIELLGRGGMGAVYKARQKTLNRIVALKILPVEIGADEHFAERFQREAQALAKLNHPNIVTVFEVGQRKGLFYFLMEFVDGANLRALIRGGEMTPGAMLALIPAFCDALQYAHDEGIVHRDIKPENVLVDKKGRVKIADFGLAKLLGRDSADHTLTRTGMHLGTPRYMAPEQMDKPETVDHRADIYSLGVVFYEMLTGEVPMGRFEPPSRKVQIDVKLDEIVMHAMEREPARRYQHASEIKTDVENVASMPRGAPPQERKRKQVHWASAFGLLLLNWLLPALLWNFRGAGCFVALLLMGGLFTALVFRRMQGLPVLMQSWSRLSLASQRARLAGGVLTAALGFFFLFSAMESRWEARPLNWNRAGQSSQEFAAAHKGQEYKLIRQLTAFKDQVPAVELFPNGGSWRGGWNVMGIFGHGGPHNSLFGWLSIAASLVMALLCLGSVLTTMASPAGWRALLWNTPKWVAWRASMSLTGAALLSGLCAYAALWMLQGLSLPGSRQWLDRPRFSVAIKPALAREAFEKWTWQEGYATGDQSKWNLDTVPKGETLGEVSLWQAWKPSPFDRWRMTRHGFERVSPHLVLTTISSDKPAETLIQISVGLPPKDPQIRETWEAALKSLESVMKTAGSKTADTPAQNQAAVILEKMARKYADLSSFSATGKTIGEIAPAAGGAAVTSEYTFTMSLARPDFYRIEWTQKVIGVPGLDMQGAVWSAGKGPHLLMPGGKVSQLLNREQALAVATGISGGAAHRAPFLFFNERSLDWLQPLKNPVLQPDERIGDEDCHVIAADRGRSKEVIWITKKNFLLKQIRSTTGGGEMGKGISKGLAETSDASLKKIMKMTGQDASDEKLAEVRKSLQAVDKTAPQRSVTMTQTFENIVVNELMEKADFEHPVPAADTPPPAVKAP